MSAALAIHLLTSLGGVCALQAIFAFFRSDAALGFVWLGLALIIDGIDGPLARRFRVKDLAPHISGEVLDLVVDYLTYVFAPVVALVAGGHLIGIVGQGLAAAILMSSLVYFADVRMKDAENRFVGFPALWNIVAFYVAALGLGTTSTAVLVALGVVLTFVPLRWVHPLRVRQFRGATIVVTIGWTGAALATLAHGFPAPGWAVAILVGVVMYWLALTALWCLRAR